MHEGLEKVNFPINDFGITGNVDLLSVIEEEEVKQPQTQPKKQTTAAPGKKQEEKIEEEEEEVKEEFKIDEILNTDNEELDNHDDGKSESGENKKVTSEEKVTEFESLSKGLMQVGVFTEDGEVPKTEEEFIARFEQEKQKGASEWLNNFLSAEHGPEGIDIFKAIFVDKVDPREYFTVYNDTLNLAEIDIDDESHQKTVFKEYYSRLGWPSAKIESKLEKAIEYGDLASDSKDFHEELLKQNEKKLKDIEEESKAKQLQQVQIEREYIDTITKIINEKLPTKEINGIPLNPDVAKKVVDFLTTKKYQTPDKQKLTEFDKFILETKRPENLSQRILIALLAQSNFDFSKIEKRAVTKSTKSVFAGLIKEKNNTAAASTTKVVGDSFAKLL